MVKVIPTDNFYSEIKEDFIIQIVDSLIEKNWFNFVKKLNIRSIMYFNHILNIHKTDKRSYIVTIQEIISKL